MKNCRCLRYPHPGSAPRPNTRHKGRPRALRCAVGTDVEALRAAAAAAAAVGVAVAIVSAAAEKFMVYISVPPAAEAAGLDCKAWLAAALAPAAGKGGGR